MRARSEVVQAVQMLAALPPMGGRLLTEAEAVVRHHEKEEDLRSLENTRLSLSAALAVENCSQLAPRRSYWAYAKKAKTMKHPAVDKRIRRFE